MPTLSEILKSKIGNGGKSKAYVADALGVSEKTVENYMNGKRSPKPNAMVKLSQLLGFNLSELSEPVEQIVPHETPVNKPKIDLSDKDKIISLLEERVASLKEDNESLKRRLNLVASAVLEQLSMIHAKVETNQSLLSELMVKQKVVPTDSIDDKIDKENAENFLRERRKLEHIVPL